MSKRKSSSKPEIIEETEVVEEVEEMDETENTAEELFEEAGEEERICPHCGIKTVSYGHEFCYSCEKELLHTKVPFGGIAAALVGMAIFFFCSIVIILISVPCLQTVKGNVSAKDNNWLAAYNNYAAVEESLTSITDTLGDVKLFNPYLKIGCGLQGKLFESISHMHNPVTSYQYADYIFVNGQGYLKHNKLYNECKEYSDEVNLINEKFGNTFENLSEIIQGDVAPTDSMGQEYLDKMEAFRGKKDVNDFWLSFLEYDIASGFMLSNETQLKYLDAAHKAAQNEKKEYYSFYYSPYIDLLIDAGRIDEATKLCDELYKKDISNYDVAAQRLKIYIINGELEEAEKYVNEFTENNLTIEFTQSYSNYCLNIILARANSNYTLAKQLCEEGISKFGYSGGPEIHRQLLLIYLYEGKYTEAFDTAIEIDEILNVMYMNGNSSGITDEVLASEYVATELYAKYGNGKSANDDALEDMQSSFVDSKSERLMADVISGKVDVKKLLTEGGRDLI